MIPKRWNEILRCLPIALFISLTLFIYLFTSDKKSVLFKASDDDGEPNTYDYQDSFLDDGTQPKDDSDVSEDSSEEEDIKGLVKEAKKFKKNKKLRQK